MEIYNLEETMLLNNKELNIDKELTNFIQYKLNKTYFNKEDLKDIDDIILNGKKMNGDINKVDFNELKLFPNLKKIEIKNLNINKSDIENINNLKYIDLRNCTIESIENLKDIENMTINNSTIMDFNNITKLSKLKTLELINIDIDDFKFLKELKNIEILKIKNIKDFSLDKIDFNLPIKYLSIEGIEELNDKFIIKNYPNLEVISVDIKEQKKWKENLENIENKGIKILLNDIYEY